MNRRIRVVGLVSLALLCLLSALVSANVLLRFSPDLGGGPPFYARIERLENGGGVLVHNDGEWAAVAFYRAPGSVPADFNLLDLFDGPRAFDATLTVEGFEIWRIAPWEPGAGSQPNQLKHVVIRFW